MVWKSYKVFTASFCIPHVVSPFATPVSSLGAVWLAVFILPRTGYDTAQRGVFHQGRLQD